MWKYFVIMASTYDMAQTFAMLWSKLLDWTRFKPIELEGTGRLIYVRVADTVASYSRGSGFGYQLDGPLY